MDALGDIAGTSPAIEAVREHVRRVLARRAAGRLPPLLLEGETGTGKGLLARVCHRASPRATGPFVSVNCAAIPESLLEAELFGFDRGAFTGADTGKPGLFQSAHRGTIFLDEIGLLGEAVQAKLLAVLDEPVLRRLGSTRTESFDVWVIAATNVDLEDAVHAGRFREDLYHRLAVVPIRLPPLRERGGDIVLLAERFLAAACEAYKLPARILTSEAKAALLAYRWPGNVRQLGNVIERAALLSTTSRIDASMLALSETIVGQRADGPTAAAAGRTPEPVSHGASGYRATLDELERGQLLDALTQTGWNVARAAQRLGVPRNTLRYRMARHRLAPPTTRRARESSADASAAASPSGLAIADLQRAVAFLRVVPVASPDGERAWVIASWLDLAVEKIETFGGRIIHRGVAGLDAAFGLEPAEDAAVRAANAALAVRTLAARAGTVVCVIEVLTCRLEAQGDAIGIPPDVLPRIDARLCGLVPDAVESTIVVGPGAAAYLQRDFVLERAGDVGGDAAMLMRREGRGDGARDASLARRSAFVGRSEEIAFLGRRLQQIADTGRGHIVGLMGEPGVGKSRLLAEFTRAVAGGGVPVLEGRCASHTSSSGYALLLDILRRAWALEDDLAPEVTIASVSGRLTALGVGAQGTEVILSLLGLREGVSTLSPEAIKTHAFQVVSALLVAHAAAGGPALLLLEDLHWADRTSEEYLSTLVDSLPGTPILVIATMRAGYRAPWLDRSWASQLALPPLSLDDSLTIVRGIKPDLAAPVAESLARRGEGNPFFLEELCRAVEDGTGASTLIPGTVTDVVHARMDRLPAGPRRVLEVASVIGREVSLQLLTAVTGSAAEDLAAPLRHLVDTEFMYEQPGGVVFKHALTQEVAYRRLTDRQRVDLHTAAGRAFERLYAERIDEALHALTYHWGRTEDHATAVRYLRRLADRAVTTCAPAEALAALEQALRTGERLPDGLERERTVLGVATDFAAPLILLGRFEQVKSFLLQYQARVERLDDPAISGPFFASLAFPHDHTGEHRLGERFARRAVASATQAGDRMTVGKALTMLTLASLWAGCFQEGIERAELAVDVLTTSGGAFWLGLTLWVKAHHEILLGRLDAALRSGEALWRTGVQSENGHFQSYGACLPGWIATLRGKADAGIARGEEALALAPDPVAEGVVLGYLGEALGAAGRHDEARARLTRSVEICRALSFPQVLAWNLARWSEAERAAGDSARARTVADEALRVAEAAEFPFAVALARRALGRVAHAQGDLDGAQAHLGAALGILSRIDARYHAAVVRVDLAVSLAKTGTAEQAAALLGDALREFDAIAVAPWSRRVRDVADELALVIPGRRPGACD